MKTSGLKERALDWAVTKAEGHDVDDPTWWPDFGDESCYTTDWAQGGPIIEREKMFVKPTINKGWRCYQRDPAGNGICHSQYGPTPLIAAMRCYVASKLGDEVDVPEALQ